MFLLSMTLRNHKLRAFCLISCVCIFVLLNVPRNDIGHDHYMTVYGNRSVSSRSIKNILIWNPFLTQEVREGFRTCVSRCSLKCEISEDKSAVSNADAVIFHAYDLWPLKMNWILSTQPTVELPTTRRSEQVWVLFNQEPPCNIFWDATLLNGLFNWTAWYRRDATIWWPYGKKYDVKEPAGIHRASNDLNQNNFREKTKDIAGMISNCADQAQRYKLVHTLQKFLKIDMYGECYDHPCGQRKSPKVKTCENMLRKYKFYLAFENSHCKDYVTEKYWQSLNRNQIPIVNWKDKQDSIVIPYSFINIYDFNDITSFSEYIIKVMNNETLYNSYFQWKTTFVYEQPCVMCDICRVLNDRTKTAQVYHDLDSWIKDDTCPKFSIFSHGLKFIFWKLFWMFGVDIEQT